MDRAGQELFRPIADQLRLRSELDFGQTWLCGREEAHYKGRGCLGRALHTGKEEARVSVRGT